MNLIQHAIIPLARHLNEIESKITAAEKLKETAAATPGRHHPLAGNYPRAWFNRIAKRVSEARNRLDRIGYIREANILKNFLDDLEHDDQEEGPWDDMDLWFSLDTLKEFIAKLEIPECQPAEDSSEH